MPRWRAALVLAGALAAPSAGRAEALYAFADAGGVLHYANVQQDARYRLVAGEPGAAPRATAAGKAARRAAAPRGPRAAAWDAPIRAAAARYGLAPPLLKAVMAAESNFDARAVSLKGAAGLMQLMPGTARELSVRDRLDPAESIEGGARYLRQLHDRFGGDLARVLAAYNAGPERVSRADAVPAIPETQAYVRRVLELYEAYRRVE
jgi:soluble lytic murein transglycosylase-like protein